MSTFDTKQLVAESSASPVTSTFDAWDTANILVIGITTTWTTARAWWTPTFNWVELTQAWTAEFAAEWYSELRYLLAPAVASSTLSVPNTWTALLQVCISTYISSTWYFEFDVTSQASWTTDTPTTSITPTAATWIIVDSMFTWDRDIATANNRTLLYSNDTGSEWNAYQYYLNSWTTAIAMSYTQRADDWAIVAWAFIESDEPEDPPSWDATNFKINIWDSWKTVDAMKINIGDSWKSVANAWINIWDSWKEIYTTAAASNWLLSWLKYYYKLDWDMVDEVAWATWTNFWATSATWILNNWLSFDWVNDYATFPHSSISVVNNFTINFWYKYLWGQLIYFKEFRWNLTASNYAWFHFYTSWAETWFRKVNSSTTLQDTKFSNTTLNDWGLHMVTITQSSTAWCNVYVDNSLIKTEARTWNI